MIVKQQADVPQRAKDRIRLRMKINNASSQKINYY